jgi:hypothetical protein
MTTAAPTLPEELTLSVPFVLDLEAKQAGDGKPRFSLVANSGTEPMKVAGFYDPVVIDLAGATFDRQPTPVIQDHDTAKRIGHTTKQAVTSNGIMAEGVVSSTSPEATSFVADAKAGFPFQVSVGAAVQEAVFVPKGQSATVNGKTFNGPLIVAKKTLIRELSVTVLGADKNTSALVAQANKNHHQKGKTMSTTTTNDHDTILAAERERVGLIDHAFTGLAGAKHVAAQVQDLRAKAMKGEVDVADLPERIAKLSKLEGLYASMPGNTPGTAIHIRGGMPTSQAVLEAAVAGYACGSNINLEATYGEATAEAASRLGVSCLMDAAKLVVQATGQMLDWRNKDAVIRAAFSTADLGNILSNVASKSLEAAYKAFPSAARIVAKKLDADNFKAHTGLRLTGDVAFQKVAKDGEIKHGSLSDSAYTYRVETFARMLGLDRQTLIDDDTNALDELPRMFGRGAALAVEETFWTLVLANTGSFFHANNKNLVTGATSVLGGTGLGLGVQKFLEQTDANGKPIGVVPKWLVVGPPNKVTADELFVSRTFNVGGGSTTASDKVTTANAFFGLYQPVVSPWIASAGGISGASDTCWYLFGDPRDVAAFGLAYLNGSEAPTIEQVDQPANKLGVQWRAYLDFGACQIDHRGAVRSAGA